MISSEVKYFNIRLTKRMAHEPQKPISNKRRWQLMTRYLHSTGVR